MLKHKCDKYTHLVVPIFRTNLYVTHPQFKKEWFDDTKIKTKTISPSMPDMLASCEKVEHKTGAMALFICLPKRYNESTTWHECIHAARAVLEYVGVDVDDEDDEMIPYLTEWIVKMVKHYYYGKKVDFEE